MEKPSLLTHLEVLALTENAGRTNGPTMLQAKSPQWEDFGISMSGGINYTLPLMFIRTERCQFTALQHFGAS